MFVDDGSYTKATLGDGLFIISDPRQDEGRFQNVVRGTGGIQHAESEMKDRIGWELQSVMHSLILKPTCRKRG